MLEITRVWVQGAEHPCCEAKGFPARPSLAHDHPPLAPVHAVDLESGETWCGAEAQQVHTTLMWPPMPGTACPDCQDCSEPWD